MEPFSIFGNQSFGFISYLDFLYYSYNELCACWNKHHCNIKATIAKKKSSYSCSSKHKLIMAHARKEGHKNYLKHFNSKQKTLILHINTNSIKISVPCLSIIPPWMILATTSSPFSTAKVIPCYNKRSTLL